MTDLEKYLELARDLLARDRDLRLMQQAYDRMARLEYELPAALRALQWVRLVKTSAPHDSLRGATRALSSLDERLKIQPISVSKSVEGDPQSLAARTSANHWEQCLKWQMDKAAQRTPIFRSDIIRSSVLYDEICGQIIHLPTQEKLVGGLNGKTNRYKAARRLGDFVIRLKNPQCVHAQHSPYGLESALCVDKWTAKEVRNFWGDKAIDEDEKSDVFVVFDYTDYDVHLVWAYPGDREDVAAEIKPDSSKLIRLMDEENPYPFINWSCVVGGTNLDPNPAHQRQPLLYPVYQTEQWITQNIAGTLAFSQGIAEAGRPNVKATGPDPDSVVYDFSEPGGKALVPPGHDLIDMAQRQLDPALMQMVDRLDASISTATIARVLVTAEAQAGESYSGFNLRVQTAIGALLPYKSLGERFFEQAYRTMLYWVHYSKTPISGYSQARKTFGELYTINPEDVDPEQLYLTVELTPDVPSDRLQKINGAGMLKQMGYPMTKILEELGETDPEGTLREGVREQMWMAAVQGKIQRIQQLASGQYEQDVMAAAQALIEQQMAQMQQAPDQTQAPEFGPPDMSGMDTGMGMEEMSGMGGPGFAPPMGGTPPIQAGADMATFEGANLMPRAMA